MIYCCPLSQRKEAEASENKLLCESSDAAEKV